MKVIRGYVASVGYEDSNPFSLCEWAAKCGSMGYSKEVYVGGFNMALITEEDDKIVKANRSTNIIICDSEEELKEYEEIDDDDIIIMSINEMESLKDGDIEVTRI